MAKIKKLEIKQAESKNVGELLVLFANEFVEMKNTINRLFDETLRNH